MLKKVIISGLFLAFVAVLVAGAVNRTINKSEGSGDGNTDSSLAERSGRGQSAGRDIEVSQSGEGSGRGQNQEVQGIGGGRQGQVSQERGYPKYQEAPAELMLYEGIISQVPADGVELIITTAEGEIVVGTGPLDLSEQGFDLLAGESLRVHGYWEDEEFKATELTQVESDRSITLRDDMGRPVWSGAGKNAVNLSERDRSNGRANGGFNDESGQSGTGLAEVEQWITLSGTVLSVNESALVVELANGQPVSVANRPWWFAREQGFDAANGDDISLIGFYEGDAFEVGQINNLTDGTMVQIRQESGRPSWAGGGQRAY